MTDDAEGLIVIAVAAFLLADVSPSTAYAMFFLTAVVGILLGIWDRFGRR